MKEFLSTILIAAILSYQFSTLIIYVSFKINQDYIAKNLCVEKDIEGSTCKGCCQLKKKMYEQEEQQKNIPALSTSKIEIFFFNENPEYLSFLTEASEHSDFYFQNKYKYLSDNSVFRPPQRL